MELRKNCDFSLFLGSAELHSESEGKFQHRPLVNMSASLLLLTVWSYKSVTWMSNLILVCCSKISLASAAWPLALTWIGGVQGANEGGPSSAPTSPQGSQGDMEKSGEAHIQFGGLVELAYLQDLRWDLAARWSGQEDSGLWVERIAKCHAYRMTHLLLAFEFVCVLRARARACAFVCVCVRVRVCVRACMVRVYVSIYLSMWYE